MYGKSRNRHCAVVAARHHHADGGLRPAVPQGQASRAARVVQGSGTVFFPMGENSRGLALELMSFDVAPKQDLYTRQGVAVTVEAVAQIKVKSDPESILTAAEQFLTKPPDEREGLIRLVMEGHLRGTIHHAPAGERAEHTQH